MDALEDPDRDGLTTAEEFALGTDPANPDTDRDGITDGEEVTVGADGFVTNPLLVDTDGDGLSDPLEIATGSDPADPTNFNLARALTSMTITPSNFVITLNTIVGEASRQLSVIGNLRDGTTINLTSTQRGTNYTSSDLTVCNFGAEEGRVFAGNAGVCTITVTNSGFNAITTVTIRTFAPTALSSLSIPGTANKIDVAGNYAYVASGTEGLQVVDVSDRTAPRMVGVYDTAGNANDVKVVGNIAYVADGSAGLQIVDVGNPSSPATLGALDTPGDALGIAVSGSRAYVADGASGLAIIDVRNLRLPVLLGMFDTPGRAQDVDVAGNIAVVADGGGIRIVDAGDPGSPIARGSLSTQNALGVTVEDSIAYLADFTGSLKVIDFSDPAVPRLLATTPQSLGGMLLDAAKAGNFVFGADIFFVNGVPIVEVGDPANPRVMARIDFPGDATGTGIAADNQFIYLTTDTHVLYIGQYLQLDDTAGIAPTARMTSPRFGDAVIEGSTVPMTVEAMDDIRVASVNFLVDGQVAFMDNTPPYQFNLTVPVDVASVTLGATAIDFGGNVGIAPDVLVPVIPDPPPSVAITAPTEGAIILDGSTIEISADATDNIRVVSVLFEVDGVRLPLDETPPFSAQYNVHLGISALTVAATATDNLGKTATAARSVVANPNPALLSGNIHGTVFAADGQTPVANAVVEILDAVTGQQLAILSTDGAGFYQVFDIRVRNEGFSVVAHAPTDFSITASQTGTFTIAGETVTIHLQLPVSVVKGAVFFSDGITPVPFPSVFLTQTDPSSGETRTFFPNTTDANGRYSILGISVGDFTVMAQESGLSGTATGTLSDLTMPVNVNLLLQPSGTVAGTVFDIGNNVVPFAQVALTSGEPFFDRFTDTDAQGVYRFDHVALGSLTVQALDAITGSTGIATGTLETDGETVTVNVTIVSSATGTVTGTIFGLDGVTPVPNAFVVIETFSLLGSFETRVDADESGHYTAAGVPVGTIRVTATDPASFAPRLAGMSEGTLTTTGPATINVTLEEVPF